MEMVHSPIIEQQINVSALLVWHFDWRSQNSFTQVFCEVSSPFDVSNDQVKVTRPLRSQRVSFECLRFANQSRLWWHKSARPIVIDNESRVGVEPVQIRD